MRIIDHRELGTRKKIGDIFVAKKKGDFSKDMSSKKNSYVSEYHKIERHSRN